MNIFSMTKYKKPPSQKMVFMTLFGVSFAAFAAGFGDCMFDIDKAEACVAHAHSWVDKFAEVGNHLLQWMIAIGKAAFSL